MRAQPFTRTQGGVTIPDAGTLLVDRARPSLTQIAKLKHEVEDRAAGQLPTDRGRPLVAARPYGRVDRSRCRPLMCQLLRKAHRATPRVAQHD